MHAAHEHPVARPQSRWRRALDGWLTPGEPHLARGPFTRWPRAADGVLALAVFAGSAIAVTASAVADGDDYTIGSIIDLTPGRAVLLAAGAIALLWRRHQPIAVATATMAVMAVWAIAQLGDGQDLALAVAAYSVGRYTADHRHSVAIVVAAVTVSALGTVVDTNQRVDVVPAVVLTALPWYVGRRVRNRGDYVTLLRERSERLEADQRRRERRAVADERSRIARELHDVVAHQVSMMTVQAGAAKTIARDDLDAAIEAMGEVEHSGRRTLGELRHLLGVLRPQSADDDDLGPQRGIADVPSLIDELARTGADVTLHCLDRPDPLPSSVDLSVYRIVQESITNVVKHAGPAPTVDVSITADGDSLVVEVVNTTANGPDELPSSGYGLAGMRERVTLLGGTLVAAPEGPGSFRVCAVIPLAGQA